MRIVDLQSADGIAIRNRPYGIILQTGKTVPTDGSQGYSPGCLFTDMDGSSGSQNYINTGTYSSCAFKVLTSTGVDLTSLVATAAELNRAAQNSTRPVAVGAAALTVTQALHDGKTIMLDRAAGIAVTLPAMTGSGARYRFAVTATASGGSYVITATGAHLFGGVVQNNDTGASGLFGVSMATNAGGSTTITLNGTTQGGRKGDWIEIEDLASGYGQVRGLLNGSGTEATPFS